jgi:hypothetical protein
MPTLKNSRRERFARLLASGKTAIDAYDEAGYSRNDGNAAAMAKKEEIKNRVMEINGLAAQRAAITKERLIEWADEIRREACARGQYSAAIAALKEIGLLTGLRIERSQRGRTSAPSDSKDAGLSLTGNKRAALIWPSRPSIVLRKLDACRRADADSASLSVPPSMAATLSQSVLGL